VLVEHAAHIRVASARDAMRHLFHASTRAPRPDALRPERNPVCETPAGR
jgi:hypothetical protein